MDLEILRRTPLFANLDDAAFALLTDDIQEIDLSRNAVLFYEGDQDDQLFAVLSGKVKLGRTAADGAREHGRHHGPRRRVRRDGSLRSFAPFDQRGGCFRDPPGSH